jgi:hypothetical protein
MEGGVGGVSVRGALTLLLALFELASCLKRGLIRVGG